MRNKILGVEPYIKYDIFGTKTGRLTTKKNSFPILTLAKEYRSVMKPKNDRFVEFDFNAAELRTLLALSGKKQPKEDIHEWNVKNVYRGLVSRKEAKQKIFAWLYNPESKDYLSDRIYDRGLVIKKYFDGAQVSTFFNRTIPADEHHALNYIIQSTTSDLFLRRMIEVHNFLRDKKSFISFCLHDSLVIDFAEEEKHLISEIKQIFSETDLGRFVVNISVGKNFGEMKRIKL
jgi:DNA polymerase I-like protein with 3'-5' exonuclease and polymerase domains